MSVRQFTAAQAARLRLQCQSLVGGGHATIAAAAEHMLALQGQDFNAVQWALGVRTPGSTRQDVFDAFNSGAIVRGWPMRGTLHALPADVLPWFLELTTERVLRGVERRWEHLGIDEAWLERARDITVQLLKGGKQATRAQFVEALHDAGFEPLGQRAYHAIWYLSQTGTLVWGPVTPDGEHQLVLSSEWLPKTPKFDREAALGELLRRYIHARGPVTLKDFGWWASMTQGDAKLGLAAADEALVEVTVDGTTMYMSAEALETHDPASRAASTSTLALPAFDEHLLGYQTRDIQLPREHANAIVPGSNGMFKSTVAIGGVTAGTWARTKRAKRTDVTVDLFSSWTTAQQKRFAASIARYAEFLGTPVEVVS